MKRLACLFLSAAVSACGLTPEQIEAIGKSKTGTSMCNYTNVFGKFESSTTVTNVGTGNRAAQVTVTPNCATNNAQGSVQ